MTVRYKNQKETSTAKLLRIAKENYNKPGGKTYENAVAIQRAESIHSDYRKETLKLVEK